MPRQHQAVSAPKPCHENTPPVNTFSHFSSSFIRRVGEPAEPWVWFPDTLPSFIVFTPPREPLAKADIYGALNVAAEYLDASQGALREGDDNGVRAALEVLRSIVAVALAQLHKSSPSENRVLQ
jgi:hypothetical protein